MNEEDKIPLLSEINLDEVIDTYWYKYYPTTVHRDNDSPWFGPGSHVRAEIEVRRKIKEELDMYLMWGKKPD